MELGNFRWHVRTWHRSRGKDSKAVVALRRGKSNKAVEAQKSRNRAKEAVVAPRRDKDNKGVEVPRSRSRARAKEAAVVHSSKAMRRCKHV